MTARRAFAPVPFTRVEPGILREEVLVVLSLSLLASAVYAVLDLLAAPIKGATAFVYPQFDLAKQVAELVLALAPVWLVLHLLRRDGDTPAAIGLGAHPPREALLSGLLLFVVVGLGGLAVYFGSVALGVNRFVVPVPPMGHWWTVPVIVLGAAQAALLEEVVVLGYLITRLRQIGASPYAALAASALLRGSYHLYQGWGGFLGNAILGILGTLDRGPARRLVWGPGPLVLVLFLVPFFSPQARERFRR